MPWEREKVREERELVLGAITREAVSSELEVQALPIVRVGFAGVTEPVVLAEPGGPEDPEEPTVRTQAEVGEQTRMPGLQIVMDPV